MQKISLSSLRISELIENPRPSTHKRRLFSRFALGMIGMHDSTGVTASFRQTKSLGGYRGRRQKSWLSFSMLAQSCSSTELGKGTKGEPALGEIWSASVLPRQILRL